MVTMIQRIRDNLSDSGFNVYYPAQHKGICKEPYIVIKNNGSIKELDISTDRPIYELLLYVPYNRYSYIETYLYDVKLSMRQLYPILQYRGEEKPVFYDEDVKGYMSSIEYIGTRKLL